MENSYLYGLYMIPPCKDCKTRYEACHIVCEKYKDYSQKRKESKQAKEKYEVSKRWINYDKNYRKKKKRR